MKRTSIGFGVSMLGLSVVGFVVPGAAQCTGPAMAILAVAYTLSILFTKKVCRHCKKKLRVVKLRSNTEHKMQLSEASLEHLELNNNERITYRFVCDDCGRSYGYEDLGVLGRLNR